MSEILRYVLVDKDDQEGTCEYSTCQEAIRAAGTTHAVVCHTYTFEDSELVWTPDGSNTWPPKSAASQDGEDPE